MKKSFTVEGMSCSACSSAVEKVVGRIDGVTSASVNLLAKTLICEYDDGKVSVEDIKKAVSKAGFSAEEISEKKEKPSAPTEQVTPIKTRLTVSFVFLALLMYISMGHMIGLPLPFFFVGHESAVIFAFTQLLLSLPVLYVNRKFFISGIKAVRNKAPNMDTLVALGAASGIVYGIFAIYMIAWGQSKGDIALVDSYRHSLYFESSSMLLTLVTLGKFFEERSKNKTGDALRGLEKLSPETVTVERDGKEYTIPFESLRVGDILILRPGSRAAADGIIVEGGGSFDVSSLTGESVPVYKSEGDEVISASLLTDSYVKLRAVSVGKDTTLSQIISLVENASATKAPVAKLADKISRIFVPTVMGISLVTLAVWLIIGSAFEFALARALSVLVISCPCALGLATPVAVTVSVGRLAGDGILVKNASWAELMSEVKTIVFDKTGTITHGKMKVSDVISDEEDALLTLAASLEHASEHPVARAITEYCKDIKTVEIADFRAVAGRGVAGLCYGKPILGGNRAFMTENSVNLGAFEEKAKLLEAEGKTLTFFAADGIALGIISVCDTVKEGATDTISALRSMGIKTVLLTGDTNAAAKAVADDIGIDEVIAEVLPADKERYIKQYRESGRVAMVGDGVNDSPSLASADVGISPGNATDIAADTSDIIVISDDLRRIVRIVTFAKTSLRIMKENLFWAFIYNVIGIPVAAGVFAWAGILLTPAIGAAAMSFSSLFVVTNALRLLRK